MSSIDRYLLSIVDAGTLSRAVDYVNKARVLSLSQSEQGMFYGRVAGSGPSPYVCAVVTEPGPEGAHSRIVRTYCGCPMQTLCKHAIACFLTIQSGEVMPSRALAALRSLQARSTAKPPSFNGQTWLKKVAEAMGQSGLAAEPENLEPYGSKQRIIYVFSLKQHHRHGQVACLTLFRGTIRPDGGFRRVVPLTELSNRVVMPADQVALSMLDEDFDDDSFEHDVYDRALRALGNLQITYLVRGPAAAQTLRTVAATGRLHMSDVEGPLMSAAQPRWGKLVWLRDAALAQKLTLVLEPRANLIMLEEVPYYIDVSAGAIGRVVTDVHPELLAQLTHAPPISPEEAAAFAASIPAAQAAQIPAPEVLPVRDLEAAPSVRLAVRQAQEPEAAGHMLAELHYSYAGADVVADAESDTVYVRDAQGIGRIKRQRSQERRAHRQLVKASGVKQREKTAKTVDLGPCADKQAFYALSEQVLAPLKAEGWHIDSAAGDAATIVHPDGDNPDASIQQSTRGGWFELDMGIVVDNQRISLPPLLLRLLHDPTWGLNTAALAASGRQTVFVPINDTEIVSMPTDRIIDLLGMLESLGDMAELQGDGVLRLPLSDAHLLLDLKRRDKLQLMAPDGLARLAATLRDSASPPPVPPPTDLRATLRGYQCVGMSWLQMLRANSLGGILADDMGLGKTLQTLAHILVEKNAGRLQDKALIVCPTSVLGTWVEACDRFTPTLRLQVHHGPQRQYAGRETFDILVTTYGTLLRDAGLLAEASWSIYVLDEAQMVKNAVSKSYIAACRVDAQQHIALTGTPLENGVRELWAVVNWAMPGLLGTRNQFDKQFVKPIEVGADVNRRSTLVSRLRPFLMRRTKAQVVLELPEKTEVVEHVELGQKQRDLYEIVRASLDAKVREEIKARGMARSMLTVLDALLKLRQVCCDPRLVKDVKIPKGCTSAKLERLLEMLPDMIEAGRRILIFSQFTSMLALIEHELQQMQIDYVKLTGQSRQRQSIVEQFRSGHIPVFLISLKAGGTGLNLPEADTVIHYDPWWNPAVEDQATSRAHRMGQNKAVFVYKLVVEGSVEAKILKLQDHKRSLFAALMEGKDLGGKLTERDIDSLLAPLG